MVNPKNQRVLSKRTNLHKNRLKCNEALLLSATQVVIENTEGICW